MSSSAISATCVVCIAPADTTARLIVGTGVVPIVPVLGAGVRVEEVVVFARVLLPVVVVVSSEDRVTSVSFAVSVDVGAAVVVLVDVIVVGDD
jgi:hypothetical protein